MRGVSLISASNIQLNFWVSCIEIEFKRNELEKGIAQTYILEGVMQFLAFGRGI